jgi:hypothetical protein
MCKIRSKHLFFSINDTFIKMVTIYWMTLVFYKL